jgi:hypothetical protein
MNRHKIKKIRQTVIIVLSIILLIVVVILGEKNVI